MPMYGLRWIANRSIAKRRQKAKRALAASTIPDQLSQLRKLRLKGRGCAGAGASGIAAIIYGRPRKVTSKQPNNRDPENTIEMESIAQTSGCTAALQSSSRKNL